MPNSKSAMGEGKITQRARLTPEKHPERTANPRAEIKNKIIEFDSISNLPKPIIHQIMSLLSYDTTTQMSILSKHFLSVWRAFPVVEFDHSKFKKASKFIDHITTSLQRREISTDLESLSLRIQFLISQKEKAEALMRYLMSFAFQHRVKNLFIHCDESLIFPTVSDEIFGSKAVREITLAGVDLKERSLVVKCPLMESLSICQSDTSKTKIELFCPKLKSAKLDGLKGLSKVEMDEETAASLESFKFGAGIGARQCEIVNLGLAKSIKTLELYRINVNDEWLEKVVSQLVLIEKLKLNTCRVLRSIQLLNERLSEVEIELCEELESIEIATPSLSSFRYVAQRWYRWIDTDIDLINCPNMKRLVMVGAGGFLSRQWISETVTKLKLLEKVVFDKCDSMGSFFLDTFGNVKELGLIGCDGLKNFEIYAPNLEVFVYEGEVLVSAPNSVLSTKLEAELRFTADVNIAANLPKEFRDFLSFYGHCKTLTITFCRNTYVPFIFSSEMRLRLVSPLYDLKHLIVKLNSLKCATVVEMVENLLWLAPHPNTISIQCCNKPFLKLYFYYKSDSETEEAESEDTSLLSCCVLSPVKCWKHLLTNVEIEGSSLFNERDSLESFLVHNANNSITIADRLSHHPDMIIN